MKSEFLVEKEEPQSRGRNGSVPGAALRSVLLKIGDESGFIPELNDLLARTPVDLQAVTVAMRRHPALSTQVIGFCNSLLLPAERVLTIEEAVLLLGTERLRTVALGHQFQEYAGDRVTAAALKLFRQHSYATAALSETLARATGLELGETAYLAGLVHDLGLLPMMRDPAAVRSPVSEDDEHWLEIERSRYDTDHCELGTILAAGWKLPDEVLCAIRRHHETYPSRYGHLAGIVAAADRFCRLRGLSPCSRSESRPICRQAAEQMLAICLPTIPSDRLDGLIEALDLQFRQFLLRSELDGLATAP